MTPSGDDPDIDRLLLHKADALIRRNRPDGVGSDGDELPLLTEAVEEDLPELTEMVAAIPEPAAIPLIQAVPERVQQAFSLSLDLEGEEHLPTGQFKPFNPQASQEAIQKAVDEAVARTRRELQAEQQRVIQEACARTRADVLAEARVMHQHAVQAALAQGREEAEINQWATIQEARREAVQSAAGAMSERLIELDAQISQGINQWLAKELPPLIATELLGLSERLRTQTTAHMRATLLPELSDQISKVLESALRGESERQ
jgi:hypothetical protein